MTRTVQPGTITPADIEKAEALTKSQTETNNEADQENAMTALDVLLGASSDRQKEKIVVPQRPGLPSDLVLTIQSLTDREFKNISDEAESSAPVGNRRQRRAGATEKDVDSSLFLRLIVAAGVVDPPLDHPTVLQKHGVTRGEQVVDRILLPGEISRVAELIMDLSGFNDTTIDYAKN